MTSRVHPKIHGGWFSSQAWRRNRFRIREATQNASDARQKLPWRMRLHDKIVGTDLKSTTLSVGSSFAVSTMMPQR